MTVQDEIGADFESEAAARAEGARIANELAHDESYGGATVIVRDADGKQLAHCPVRLAPA